MNGGAALAGVFAVGFLLHLTKNLFSRSTQKVNGLLWSVAFGLAGVVAAGADLSKLGGWDAILVVSVVVWLVVRRKD